MIANVSKIVVGVDVSMKHLDVCIYKQDGFIEENKAYLKEKIIRVENSLNGLEIMLEELSRYSFKDFEQIVWESSGGYEILMGKILEKAGYTTWMVDPRRIRGFVASQGVKAKTDKIDAKMIALFAAQNKSDYKKNKQPEMYSDLRELVRRKIDLVEMVGMEKKRLRHPKQVICKEIIEAHIAFMEKQIEDVKSEINALIKDDDDWSRKAEIADSIPGVGEATIHAVLAEVPEIGSLTDKQVAAVVGVAPYPQESGSYIGQASIEGGRFLVRNVIYMAALTASRYNPDLKQFYQNLRANGKRPKVAIVAVMRKLIILINTLVRDNRIWSKSKPVTV
jgi:transposase